MHCNRYNIARFSRRFEFDEEKLDGRFGFQRDGAELGRQKPFGRIKGSAGVLPELSRLSARYTSEAVERVEERNDKNIIEINVSVLNGDGGREEE